MDEITQLKTQLDRLVAEGRGLGLELQRIRESGSGSQRRRLTEEIRLQTELTANTNKRVELQRRLLELETQYEADRLGVTVTYLREIMKKL